jgi:hypothetical protein
MLQPTKRSWILAVAALGLAGCASSAKLPVSAGTGPDPNLPTPDKSLIPLVHVVTAKGWPEGAKPVAATGTAVAAFAEDLDHQGHQGVFLQALPEESRRWRAQRQPDHAAPGR